MKFKSTYPTLKNKHSFKPVHLTVALLGCILALTSCTTNRALQEERAKQMIQEPSSSSFIPRTSNDLLRPGDEVTLLVFGHDQFDLETTITSASTLVIPLIGEISVSGYTKADLEKRLRRELANYIRDEITMTLSIRSMQNEMVSILGLVRNPSNYPVMGEASLIEVLSMAGGTSDEADLRNIQVYRTNSPTVMTIVDVPWHLENGSLDREELIIRPGDVILVPRKDNVVRELSFFLRDVVLLFGLFNTFR